MPKDHLHRRDFLYRTGAATAAASGLGLYQRLAMAAESERRASAGAPSGPLPGRAKHLIVFFMTGGLSHLDTFDYKPKLQRDHDKAMLKGHKKLLGSPYAFRPHGASAARWSASCSPMSAAVVDEFCFLHSVHGDSAGHSAATLGMLTGSVTIPMPSLGSWISYGLGTLNLDLPSFVVLAAKDPYNGFQVWDASFLPASHKGVRLMPGPDPLPNVASPVASVRRRELESLMLRDLNEAHLRRAPGDPRLAARITTFDTARGLMREAPEAFDIRREPTHTLDLYGATAGDPSSFAAQCLVARRLVERGVRVVELFDVGSNSNWDSHTEIERPPEAIAQRRPTPRGPGEGPEAARAARRDADRRLLRVRPIPLARPDPPRPRPPQRLLHLLPRRRRASAAASASVDPTSTANQVAENPVHVHDLHATILHLMGLDHTRLTYRYSGRDFRLTDVHGRVVQDVLA